MEKNAITTLIGTEEGPIEAVTTPATWIKKALVFFETKISLAVELRTASLEADQKCEQIHDIVNKVITKIGEKRSCYQIG